jgi:hypothetical protein
LLRSIGEPEGEGPTKESDEPVCSDAWAGQGLAPAQGYDIKRPRSHAIAMYACQPISRVVCPMRRQDAEKRARASRKMLAWRIARWVRLVGYEPPGEVFCLRDGIARVGARSIVGRVFANPEASEGSIS